MSFSTEEYATRLSKVRSSMAKKDLAALLISDPANIYYLIGYNAWSFYTPQVLFVPAEGPMLFLTRAMDAAGAWRTSWLAPEHILGYPEHYVHRSNTHPFDWVATTLKERGLLPASSTPKERIGVDLDAHFFSPRAYFSLSDNLSDYSLVDSGELVNWVRAIKSPAEISMMRTAARICNRAMTTAVKAIEPGIRQCDAAAAISQAQIQGLDDAGGDYPALVPLLPTGEAADTPHLTWSQERFAAGEAVVIELSGAYQRYHTPLARTLILGEAPSRLTALAAAVSEGMSQVLNAISPGTAVRELAEIWNRTLASHHLEKASRLGYSIGIGYPPDWGERTISIRTEEETILEENMTFHLIAGMWMDGYGYELSESIRVGENSVELLTDFPQELLQKGTSGG